MSIFSDFSDNVLTPIVADYNMITAAKTSATPSGTVSNTGVPNKNPGLFAGGNNTIILLVVGVVIALLVLRK